MHTSNIIFLYKDKEMTSDTIVNIKLTKPVIYEFIVHDI